MTTSAQRIIAIAASQVGYHEGRSGGHWNNHQKYSPEVPGLEWSQGQAWCSTWVSWCAMKAGLASLYPRTASTDAGAAWWKKEKRWNEYPAIAAQGYLGRNGDMYHTFLVERFDSKWVYTIEGNTNNNGSAEGDGVYRHQRLRTSPEIQGYGYPRFPEGIVSADPSWPKPKAATPKKVQSRKTRGKNVDAMIASGKRAAKNNPASKPKGKLIRTALAALIKIARK